MDVLADKNSYYEAESIINNFKENSEEVIKNFAIEYFEEAIKSAINNLYESISLVMFETIFYSFFLHSPDYLCM
jgi:hypothetical protein